MHMIIQVFSPEHTSESQKISKVSTPVPGLSENHLVTVFILGSYKQETFCDFHGVDGFFGTVAGLASICRP